MANLLFKPQRKLLEAGFLVPAIRYPTVARGSERLRVTVTAAHEIDTIERLGSHLSELRGGVQKTEIDKPRIRTDLISYGGAVGRLAAPVADWMTPVAPDAAP